MKRTVLTCAALLLGGWALADDYANVDTQTKMSTRAAEQYKVADAKFNETYQGAPKRAVPTQRDLLKKAQVSQITLCDVDCALISSGIKGDSVQAMISSRCLTDKINEREAFLASLSQCEEGDLSCSLPPAS